MSSRNDWWDYTGRNDCLAHSQGHKYLLKIGSGPNARYFYTQAQVDAYKRLKSGVKREVGGVKRFIRTQKGKKTKNGNESIYSPDGKHVTYLKTNRKRQVTKWGKTKKTGKIERGLVKGYKLLHPGQ